MFPVPCTQEGLYSARLVCCWQLCPPRDTTSVCGRLGWVGEPPPHEPTQRRSDGPALAMAPLAAVRLASPPAMGVPWGRPLPRCDSDGWLLGVLVYGAFFGKQRTRLCSILTSPSRCNGTWCPWVRLPLQAGWQRGARAVGG